MGWFAKTQTRTKNSYLNFLNNRALTELQRTYAPLLKVSFLTRSCIKSKAESPRIEYLQVSETK